MWDDAQALRKLTNALLGFCLLLLMLMALAYALRMPVFALRAVQLEGVPKYVDRKLLVQAVRDSLQGNFFTVDLEQARQAFEKLPWVRRVVVRRHFPWQLDVAIEEHVALAHWNEVDMVNVQGEVFHGSTDAALPGFTGPEDSVTEVVERYARFKDILAPLGLKIAQVTLTTRHAWQLRLDNGLVVELGREQMEARLARFAAAYPQYRAAVKSPGKYVDLRYRNGFAAGMAAG